MKEIQLGSVIHGTMRNEDIMPAFVHALWNIDKEKARKFWNEHEELLDAICAKNSGIDSDYWESDEADFDLEELFDVLDSYAPDGYYFGAHPGDGSDYGFWEVE